jgi:hypothetical protein
MSAVMMTGLEDRNRRVRRILLGIVAVLVVASFLVGIRW